MAYNKTEFSKEDIKKEKERIEEECQCYVQNLPNVGAFVLTYMSTAHKLSSKLRTIPSREVGADDIAVGIHHNIDSRRLSSDPGRWEYQWSINDMLNDADINILAGWDEYLSDQYCENSSRSNVVVAVIDTGVDYNHPDLIDMMWRNPNEIPDNGIDDDGNGIIDDIHGVNFGKNPPSGDPIDLDSHGTHCAGVIAAKQDNDQGIEPVPYVISEV